MYVYTHIYAGVFVVGTLEEASQVDKATCTQVRWLR